VQFLKRLKKYFLGGTKINLEFDKILLILHFAAKKRFLRCPQKEVFVQTFFMIKY
jgi:hypothetical protein